MTIYLQGQQIVAPSLLSCKRASFLTCRTKADSDLGSGKGHNSKRKGFHAIPLYLYLSISSFHSIFSFTLPFAILLFPSLSSPFLTSSLFLLFWLFIYIFLLYFLFLKNSSLHNVSNFILSECQKTLSLRIGPPGQNRTPTLAWCDRLGRMCSNPFLLLSFTFSYEVQRAHYTGST